MCVSEKVTFSNEKEAHTMTNFRVLEDYSVSPISGDYTDEKWEYVIDDSGTLRPITKTPDGVVVESLDGSLPCFSPKKVYCYSNNQHPLRDEKGKIVRVEGKPVPLVVWVRDPGSEGDFLTVTGGKFFDLLRAQHGLVSVGSLNFSALSPSDLQSKYGVLQSGVE